MSKGLSQLQRTIVGLLDGAVARQEFLGSGPLTTDELLAELESQGMMREGVARKIAMFTVRRACVSLLERGILEGEYTTHCDYPWARLVSWSLAKQPPPPKERPERKTKKRKAD